MKSEINVRTHSELKNVDGRGSQSVSQDIRGREEEGKEEIDERTPLMI